MWRNSFTSVLICPQHYPQTVDNVDQKRSYTRVKTQLSYQINPLLAMDFQTLSTSTTACGVFLFTALYFV
jgi:hypothetical protein